MKRRLIALASFFAALVAFAGIDPARIDSIAAHLDAPRAVGAPKPLVLAEAGRGGATIVVPENASPSQRYAAEELRDYIAKCTGETLKIASDKEPLPRRAILLGVTRHTERVVLGRKKLAGTQRLGKDGFRLVARPPHLVILGSPARGTLYGVYELLEKYAGCRWYSSWMEVTPKARRFAVPGDLDDTQRPAFALREPLWWDAFNADFSARCRFNGISNNVGEKHGGVAARYGKGLGNCHTLHSLVPPDEFFDAHPEYFAFRDGARQRKGQHCLTNPDLLKLVTERVLERIRADPGADYYGISQGDALVWHPNCCTCENCAAVDKEEESYAGTMVRFVNAVAEAVEKEFPEKTVEFLAYEYTRKPPKKTKLRHNVMPCICTYECDFSVPMTESKWHEDAAFVKELKIWESQAKKLYIWDYTTDFACYPYPFPNVYALQGNLQLYRDHHVSSVFAQGASKGSNAGLCELKLWLLSKLLWNPDRDMKELLDDFFSGFYGAGAPFARAYFEGLHRLEREYCQADPKRYLRCYHPFPNDHIPEDFWNKADALLARADAAVKGDAVREKNIRNLRFGVDFVRFRLRYAKAWKAAEAAGRTDPVIEPDAEMARLAKRLKAVLESEKRIHLGNNSGVIAKEIIRMADLGEKEQHL